MKRYCMAYEVKKEYVQKYIDMHKNCWPEQLKALRDAGAANLQIYMYGNLSIIFYECEDFDAWLEKLVNSEANKKWQEVMNPMFAELPVLEGPARISTLEKVFDLKQQLEGKLEQY